MVSTSLFHADMMGNEDGLFVQPLDKLIDWRDNQGSNAAKLGAHFVTGIAMTTASVLSLAEAITSLALALISYVVLPKSELTGKLLKRSENAAEAILPMMMSIFIQPNARIAK
ncbi:MAG: hypothetical protein WD595_05790 [Waddliaceae bacterium]